MRIQVKDKSKPSRLFFTRCLVCGSLFINHNKQVYCKRCKSAITPRTTAQELKELANKPLPEPKYNPKRGLIR